MRLALGFLRNPDDAVDASQDAFVRALEALPRFDAAQPFFPWFYAILRNVCFNRLRSRRRRSEVPLDEAGDPSPRAGAVRSAAADPGEGLSAAVRAEVDRLSPEHREVVVLRHWQELSYEEIAAAVGAPVGTVMSRLHYARRELKRALEPGGGPL